MVCVVVFLRTFKQDIHSSLFLYYICYPPVLLLLLSKSRDLVLPSIEVIDSMVVVRKSLFEWETWWTSYVLGGCQFLHQWNLNFLLKSTPRLCMIWLVLLPLLFLFLYPSPVILHYYIGLESPECSCLHSYCLFLYICSTHQPTSFALETLTPLYCFEPRISSLLRFQIYW